MHLLEQATESLELCLDFRINATKSASKLIVVYTIKT